MCLLKDTNLPWNTVIICFLSNKEPNTTLWLEQKWHSLWNVIKNTVRCIQGFLGGHILRVKSLWIKFVTREHEPDREQLKRKRRFGCDWRGVGPAQKTLALSELKWPSIFGLLDNWEVDVDASPFRSREVRKEPLRDTLRSERKVRGKIYNLMLFLYLH